MRRLITVFALIAALFILMGCGMGSKENLEQGTPVVPGVNLPSTPSTSDAKTEVIQVFTLFSGIYNGKNSGEMYTADSKKEDRDELFSARKAQEEKDGLSGQMTELEIKLADDSVKKTEHDIALIQGDLDVMKKHLEELNKAGEGKRSVSELEKLVIAYHITSLNFAIEMKEGKPEVSNFSLATAEDSEKTIQVPVPGEDGKEGTTKEEKKIEHVFGDVIKVELHKEVSFDPSTGLLSFSFTGTQGDKALVYTFEGKTSDALNEKDKKKIREVRISGDIKISENKAPEKEKPEMLVIGNWDVSQSIDETPKPKDPEITTQAHE